MSSSNAGGSADARASTATSIDGGPAWEQFSEEDVLNWFYTQNPQSRRNVLTALATAPLGAAAGEGVLLAQEALDSLEEGIRTAQASAAPKAAPKAAPAAKAETKAPKAKGGLRVSLLSQKKEEAVVDVIPEEPDKGQSKDDPLVPLLSKPREIEAIAVRTASLRSNDDARSSARLVKMKHTDEEEPQHAEMIPVSVSPVPSIDAFVVDPVVQFAAFRHFTTEEEEKMVLEVIRIGNLECRSEVTFNTCDGSAKAGVNYKETTGRLIFDDGENRKTVEIELIPDESWNPTLDFAVQLQREDAVNAELGRYLWETRVAVADCDAFPTNTYKDKVMEQMASRAGRYYLGKLRGIPKWFLFWEYCKLNFSDHIIKLGSAKLMILSQLHNIYFILKLFLNVYMVDYVLKLESDPSKMLFTRCRQAQLALVTAATVVPFATLHYIDFCKYSWKVRGTSKKKLQGAVIRKFLNYKQEVRGDLSQGTLILAITRDAALMVDFGFMNIYPFLESIGLLMMMLAYQFVAPVVFDKPMRLTVILPVVLYPLFLFSFMRLRGGRDNSMQEEMSDKMDDYIQTTDNIVLNFPLISDFDARARFVKIFEDKLQAFNSCATATACRMNNNKYFPPWLSVVLVGLYTLKGGNDVLNGGLSLGTFLIDVHIFQAMGSSWAHIYMIVMATQSTFPCLERITTLLNFPIDIPQRMALNRFRRKVTKESVLDFAEKKVSGVPEDMLNIRVAGTACPELLLTPTTRQTPDELEQQIMFSQGKLIYLSGPHSEGKSVLLRFLAGVTLSDEGTLNPVFVPSHLRCLYVSAEPLFFEGTLMDNLTLGTRPGDSDASLPRVLEICRRFGIPRAIRAMIQFDDLHSWSMKLTQTQRQLLSLARAVIANPEFLCVHKPIQILDEFTAHKTLELFRSFVDGKGICQDPKAFELRRPRTCVLTSNRKLNPTFADIICWVNEEDGVQMYKNR